MESMSSPEVGIRLEQDLAVFEPGDTIIGYVYRTAQLATTDAWLLVSLHGRARSRASSTEARQVQSSTFGLMNSDRCSYKISIGTIHIPPEGPAQEWPFALTIPRFHEPSAIKASLTPSESFLKASEAAACHLPPTFFKTQAGSSVGCNIDYFVRAELRTVRNRSVETREAIMPVKLRYLRSGPPITDFELLRNESTHTVRTVRLDPDKRDVQPSFSQKTRALFNSARVPSLSFTVELDFPTVIQLENTARVPMMLRIRPDRKMLAESCRTTRPDIKLTRMSLKIVSSADVRCKGSMGPQSAEDEVTIRVTGDLREAIVPFGDDVPPLNVGDLVNLRAGFRGQWGQQRHNFGEVSLYPTFVTYNIRVRHRLRWELHFLVAGETVKVTGQQGITVRPPTTAQQQQRRMARRGTTATQATATTTGTSSSAGTSQTDEDELGPPPAFTEEAPPPSVFADVPPPSFAALQAMGMIRSPVGQGA